MSFNDVGDVLIADTNACEGKLCRQMHVEFMIDVMARAPARLR
jgi:hypothetical protein